MEITLFSSAAFVFKMVLSLRFHIGSHVNEQLIFLLYITFRLKHFGHRFIIEVKCDFLCLYALFLFYSRGGGATIFLFLFMMRFVFALSSPFSFALQLGSALASFQVPS